MSRTLKTNVLNFKQIIPHPQRQMSYTPKDNDLKSNM
jgi:hypothetical protein